MKSVRGKRALVTGAASGIGREIALQLALEGAHVYLLDVDAEGLAEVVRDARVCGVEVVGVRCDLSKPAEIAAALSDMLAAWDGVDILVNNAGVAFYGPTEKMTAEQWDWLLGINLLAPIQITRELLPTLLSRPEAHILNVCSVAGLVAGARHDGLSREQVRPGRVHGIAAGRIRPARHRRDGPLPGARADELISRRSHRQKKAILHPRTSRLALDVSGACRGRRHAGHPQEPAIRAHDADRVRLA